MSGEDDIAEREGRDVTGEESNSDGMVVDRPDTPERRKAPRVWFVDVLRLIASFQMINGHTLDAVMVTAVRQGAFYDGYLWFRGLVSVTFLAVAGIAFHLSTLCRFERHKGDPSAVRRRFRRALLIVGVGYLLSLPWAAFHDDPAVRAREWSAFQEVGVLHCIGAALILLEVLTLLARSARQVILGSAVLAAVFILGAPLADASIDDGATHPLLNWISHQGGSPFPLFPWAGFVFVGLVVGAIAKPQGGHTPFALVLRRLVLVLLGAVLAWQVLERFPAGVFDAARHHPSTDPALNLERLAAVLALIVLLAVACRPIRRLPEFLRVLSSETLAIYALHLVILFDPPLRLGARLERSLELPAAFAASAFMLVLTCSLTYGWHRFKNSRVRGSR